MALNGICPKCGSHYIGWAMQLTQHKTCDKCGADVKIISGIQQVVSHNSLHENKKRVMDLLNTQIIPNHGNKKDNYHEGELKLHDTP